MELCVDSLYVLVVDKKPGGADLSHNRGAATDARDFMDSIKPPKVLNGVDLPRIATGLRGPRRASGGTLAGLSGVMAAS